MLYHSKWDDNLKNELHIRANKSRNSLDSNIIMKQFPEIIDEVRNRVIFSQILTQPNFFLLASYGLITQMS